MVQLAIPHPRANFGLTPRPAPQVRGARQVSLIAEPLLPSKSRTAPSPLSPLTGPQPPHHFPRQAIHPRKRKPALAQVFDGGADVVEFFRVNQQEAIVYLFDAVQMDGRILRVVFVKVELERCRNALGVYVCRNVRSAFRQLQQHSVIDVVVDEYD